MKRRFMTHHEVGTNFISGAFGFITTSITAALIGYLNELGKPYKISAPTGRAARILGRKAKTTTSTIHSMIYAPKSDNEIGRAHV